MSGGSIFHDPKLFSQRALRFLLAERLKGWDQNMVHITLRSYCAPIVAIPKDTWGFF